MWRPFASSLVEHSLQSFIVNHEKSKSTVLYSPLYRKTPQTDTNPSPFQPSQEDIDKRLDLYKNLRKKVLLQRQQIRKNDTNHEQKIGIQLRYKRKIRNQFLKDNETNRTQSLTMKKSAEMLENEHESSILGRNRGKNNSGMVLIDDKPKAVKLPVIRKKLIEGL